MVFSEAGDHGECDHAVASAFSEEEEVVLKDSERFLGEEEADAEYGADESEGACDGFGEDDEAHAGAGHFYGFGHWCS